MKNIGIKTDHATQREIPRRGFLKSLGTLPLLGFGPAAASLGASEASEVHINRKNVNALLLSATTLKDHGSLEHARDYMRKLYGESKDILLINFASLPKDRDGYEERMQRDFSEIKKEFRVQSLHRVSPKDSMRAIRNAEAFFVSGGNTFLLLRELYDRFVLELLRERILHGAPYAGSSAGANIAGTVIGTTNDFPITDVPTRRSLGIFPGVFNPHHPDPKVNQHEFESRQWKIRQYVEYNQKEIVIGVTNPGMLRIFGRNLELVGNNASAFIHGKGYEKVVNAADSEGSQIRIPVK